MIMNKQINICILYGIIFYYIALYIIILYLLISTSHIPGTSPSRDARNVGKSSVAPVGLASFAVSQYLRKGGLLQAPGTGAPMLTRGFPLKTWVDIGCFGIG